MKTLIIVTHYGIIQNYDCLQPAGQDLEINIPNKMVRFNHSL